MCAYVCRKVGWRLVTLESVCAVSLDFPELKSLARKIYRKMLSLWAKECERVYAHPRYALEECQIHHMFYNHSFELKLY